MKESAAVVARVEAWLAHKLGLTVRVTREDGVPTFHYSITDRELHDVEVLLATLRAADEKYRRLAAAVNDSGGECAPDCDTFGHGVDCTQYDYAVELVRLNAALRAAEADGARLDWLEDVLRDGNPSCEVYFAGLRHGHGHDATAFQVEGSFADPEHPEPFQTVSAATLRTAIDAARAGEAT